MGYSSIKNFLFKYQGRRGLPWEAMKITTQNMGGLNAPNKRCLLKCHLKKLVVDIMINQETKLNEVEADKFIRYYKP